MCDGCQCGACATLADDGDKAPCGDASLQLDASGRVAAPAGAAALRRRERGAREGRRRRGRRTVHAPAHTPTQTPVTSEDGPTYATGATFEALAPYAGTQPHRYADLPGAWRVAVEPVPPAADAVAVARLAGEAPTSRRRGTAPTWCCRRRRGTRRCGVRLVVAPAGTKALRVTLLRDGVEHETREVAVTR